MFAAACMNGFSRPQYGAAILALAIQCGAPWCAGRKLRADFFWYTHGTACASTIVPEDLVRPPPLGIRGLAPGTVIL